MLCACVVIVLHWIVCVCARTIYCFQVTLAKYYIDIIGLGKDSPDAQKLLQYKAPRSAKSVGGISVESSVWDLFVGVWQSAYS